MTLTTTQPDTETWTTVIQPQRKLFDLRLRQLWRYRDLILLFVRRDFVALYKQTVLGRPSLSFASCGKVERRCAT